MSSCYRLVLGIIAVGCFAGPIQAQPVSEVVVYALTVEPETLRTVLGTSVMFRNHSGRSIDVQFVGYRGWHHVSRTPDGVAVVFHQTGPHPFVVKFSDSDQAHLHGVVEVAPASGSPPLPFDCSTIRVGQVCLEP